MTDVAKYFTGGGWRGEQEPSSTGVGGQGEELGFCHLGQFCPIELSVGRQYSTSL